MSLKQKSSYYIILMCGEEDSTEDDHIKEEGIETMQDFNGRMELSG